MEIQSLSWHELAQRYPRVTGAAPQVVSWVLGTVIVAQLAADGLTLSRTLRHSRPDQSPAVPASDVFHRGVNVAGVINAHLFGYQPPAPSAATTAAPTTLSLVLSGTVATDDPARGAAVLGQTTAASKVYFAGQAVPGGAQLHAVYRDHVLLDRNGVLEALYLPHSLMPGNPQPGTPAVARAPIDFGEAAGGASASGRRAALKIGYKVASLEHPPVNEIIRPLARVINGQFRGVEIAPMASAGVFERLGLQSGDVVVAVNGAPLENARDGFATIKSLDQLPDARLSLLRDGAPVEVVLHTAELAADAQQFAIDNGPPPPAARDGDDED